MLVISWFDHPFQARLINTNKGYWPQQHHLPLWLAFHGLVGTWYKVNPWTSKDLNSGLALDSFASKESVVCTPLRVVWETCSEYPKDTGTNLCLSSQGLFERIWNPWKVRRQRGHDHRKKVITLCVIVLVSLLKVSKRFRLAQNDLFRIICGRVSLAT